MGQASVCPMILSRGSDPLDEYVIEMLHITKEFPGIKANDDVTLQLKKGEIHAPCRARTEQESPL